MYVRTLDRGHQGGLWGEAVGKHPWEVLSSLSSSFSLVSTSVVNDKLVLTQGTVALFARARLRKHPPRASP